MKSVFHFQFNSEPGISAVTMCALSVSRQSTCARASAVASSSSPPTRRPVSRSQLEGQPPPKKGSHMSVENGSKIPRVQGISDIVCSSSLNHKLFLVIYNLSQIRNMKRHEYLIQGDGEKSGTRVVVSRAMLSASRTRVDRAGVMLVLDPAACING